MAKRTPNPPTAYVKFSQAIFDDICRQIAGGASVRSICEKEGMPDRTNFRRWYKDNPELKAQYDEACLDREEHFFDQIVDIADEDPLLAFDIEKQGKTEIEVVRVDSAAVAHQKTRIDSRKWVLMRMNRKKYGDHLSQEHTGADGGPIKTVYLNNTPVEELPE